MKKLLLLVFTQLFFRDVFRFFFKFLVYQVDVFAGSGDCQCLVYMLVYSTFVCLFFLFWVILETYCLSFISAKFYFMYICTYGTVNNSSFGNGQKVKLEYLSFSSRLNIIRRFFCTTTTSKYYYYYCHHYYYYYYYYYYHYHYNHYYYY